jgi:rhodanese-related sulfurtransferase
MLENETNNSNIALVEEPAVKRPAEILRMIRQHEKLAIIDVRSGLEYDMGHIQGAVSLPREAWGYCEFLSKDEPNVVYCHSDEGLEAREAAEEFTAKGFKVVILEGGFTAWLASGLPLAAR